MKTQENNTNKDIYIFFGIMLFIIALLPLSSTTSKYENNQGYRELVQDNCLELSTYQENCKALDKVNK